ncbi:FeoA family protein [Maridesulfovibrio sp.]|uniref:FeoA family protein n=1 Tax=Maridesulfovibrio sp. TaxID=2795000 RepID=UPI0029F50FC7|nr:FeoA family protein [Maridesulfovibrio sp.]
MTTNINLSRILEGRTYSVLGFECETSDYALKLRKMGFIEGTAITLAPIKISDPMIFEIRGSRLALRKAEAEQVKVVEI